MKDRQQPLGSVFLRTERDIQMHQLLGSLSTFLLLLLRKED